MEAERTFRRTFDFSRAAINKKARTIELSFSSEFPVDRGAYQEVLSHDPGDCDLSRLQSGLPLLVAHDPGIMVGIVDDARIQGGKGRAVVRFSRSSQAEEIWQDVCEGIRRSVSVGYERLKEVARERLDQGRELIRFAWRPFEISLVSVAADPTVGVGRSAQHSQIVMNEQEDNENPQLMTRAERRAELQGDFRVRNIQAAVRNLSENHPECRAKFAEMCSRAILTGMSPEDFNASLLAAIPGSRKAELHDANIGMSANEVQHYSLTRAIASYITRGHIDGLEGEANRAASQRYGNPQGFWIPNDVVIAPNRRDLNVTIASQGGNFVQTTILTPIIEILRNRMVTQRLGVQSMAGLSGNVAIPRQTGAATAYSLPESATLTKSTQAIDQILLAPHRVGAYNEYSKQLLLQSSVDVENFIRDDLMKVVAIKWDKLVLEGSGQASEPTGILNTEAIGSVTFGGAPTWDKVVSFETALALSNVEGPGAYVTSPTVRGKWKTTPVLTAASPFHCSCGSRAPGMTGATMARSTRAALPIRIRSATMRSVMADSRIASRRSGAASMSWSILIFATLTRWSASRSTPSAMSPCDTRSVSSGPRTLEIRAKVSTPPSYKPSKLFLEVVIDSFARRRSGRSSSVVGARPAILLGWLAGAST